MQSNKPLRVLTEELVRQSTYCTWQDKQEWIRNEFLPDIRTGPSAHVKRINKLITEEKLLLSINFF